MTSSSTLDPDLSSIFIDAKNMYDKNTSFLATLDGIEDPYIYKLLRKIYGNVGTFSNKKNVLDIMLNLLDENVTDKKKQNYFYQFLKCIRLKDLHSFLNNYSHNICEQYKAETTPKETPNFTLKNTPKNTPKETSKERPKGAPSLRIGTISKPSLNPYATPKTNCNNMKAVEDEIKYIFNCASRIDAYNFGLNLGSKIVCYFACHKCNNQKKCIDMFEGIEPIKMVHPKFQIFNPSGSGVGENNCTQYMLFDFFRFISYSENDDQNERDNNPFIQNMPISFKKFFSKDNDYIETHYKSWSSFVIHMLNEISYIITTASKSTQNNKNPKEESTKYLNGLKEDNPREKISKILDDLIVDVENNFDKFVHYSLSVPKDKGLNLNPFYDFIDAFCAFNFTHYTKIESKIEKCKMNTNVELFTQNDFDIFISQFSIFENDEIDNIIGNVSKKLTDLKSQMNVLEIKEEKDEDISFEIKSNLQNDIMTNNVILKLAMFLKKNNMTSDDLYTNIYCKHNNIDPDQIKKFKQFFEQYHFEITQRTWTKYESKMTITFTSSNNHSKTTYIPKITQNISLDVNNINTYVCPFMDENKKDDYYKKMNAFTLIATDNVMERDITKNLSYYLFAIISELKNNVILSLGKLELRIGQLSKVELFNHDLNTVFGTLFDHNDVFFINDSVTYMSHLTNKHKKNLSFLTTAIDAYKKYNISPLNTMTNDEIIKKGNELSSLLKTKINYDINEKIINNEDVTYLDCIIDAINTNIHKSIKKIKSIKDIESADQDILQSNKRTIGKYIYLLHLPIVSDQKGGNYNKYLINKKAYFRLKT